MSKKKVTKNSIASMLHFADHGFERVIVHFSGGGDSGDTDDPIFLQKGEDENDPSHEVCTKRRNQLDSQILDQFKSHVSDLLNNIEDWWNNDGGQGHIEIKVPSGKYKIEVGINTTETDDYTHKGTLTND